MKKVLWLVVFSLLGCYSAPRKCQDFKTGHFYSEVRIDGVVYKSEFIRSKTLQIETYNKRKDSSKLRWINDCEVIFRTIHPKNRAERKDIHLKIISTTDSSYTFEYSYVGDTKKQQGIAYKR